MAASSQQRRRTTPPSSCACACGASNHGNDRIEECRRAVTSIVQQFEEQYDSSVLVWTEPRVGQRPETGTHVRNDVFTSADKDELDNGDDDEKEPAYYDETSSYNKAVELSERIRDTQDEYLAQTRREVNERMEQDVETLAAKGDRGDDEDTESRRSRTSTEYCALKALEEMIDSLRYDTMLVVFRYHARTGIGSQKSTPEVYETTECACSVIGAQSYALERMEQLLAKTMQYVMNVVKARDATNAREGAGGNKQRQQFDQRVERFRAGQHSRYDAIRRLRDQSSNFMHHDDDSDDDDDDKRVVTRKSLFGEDEDEESTTYCGVTHADMLRSMVTDSINEELAAQRELTRDDEFRQASDAGLVASSSLPDRTEDKDDVAHMSLSIPTLASCPSKDAAAKGSGKTTTKKTPTCIHQLQTEMSIGRGTAEIDCDPTRVPSECCMCSCMHIDALKDFVAHDDTKKKKKGGDDDEAAYKSQIEDILASTTTKRPSRAVLEGLTQMACLHRTIVHADLIDEATIKYFQHLWYCGDCSAPNDVRGTEYARFLPYSKNDPRFFFREPRYSLGIEDKKNGTVNNGGSSIQDAAQAIDNRYICLEQPVLSRWLAIDFPVRRNGRRLPSASLDKFHSDVLKHAKSVQTVLPMSASIASKSTTDKNEAKKLAAQSNYRNPALFLHSEFERLLGFNVLSFSEKCCSVPFYANSRNSFGFLMEMAQRILENLHPELTERFTTYNTHLWVRAEYADKAIHRFPLSKINWGQSVHDFFKCSKNYTYPMAEAFVARETSVHHFEPLAYTLLMKRATQAIVIDIDLLPREALLPLPSMPAFASSLSIVTRDNNSNGFPVELLMTCAEGATLPPTCVDFAEIGRDTEWDNCYKDIVSHPEQAIGDVHRLVFPFEGEFDAQAVTHAMIFDNEGWGADFYRQFCQASMVYILEYVETNLRTGANFETVLRTVFARLMNSSQGSHIRHRLVLRRAIELLAFEAMIMCRTYVMYKSCRELLGREKSVGNGGGGGGKKSAASATKQSSKKKKAMPTGKKPPPLPPKKTEKKTTVASTIESKKSVIDDSPKKTAPKKNKDAIKTATNDAYSGNLFAVLVEDTIDDDTTTSSSSGSEYDSTSDDDEDDVAPAPPKRAAPPPPPPPRPKPPASRAQPKFAAQRGRPPSTRNGTIANRGRGAPPPSPSRKSFRGAPSYAEQRRTTPKNDKWRRKEPFPLPSPRSEHRPVRQNGFVAQPPPSQPSTPLPPQRPPPSLLLEPQEKTVAVTNDSSQELADAELAHLLSLQTLLIDSDTDDPSLHPKHRQTSSSSSAVISTPIDANSTPQWSPFSGFSSPAAMTTSGSEDTSFGAHSPLHQLFPTLTPTSSPEPPRPMPTLWTPSAFAAQQQPRIRPPPGFEHVPSPIGHHLSHGTSPPPPPSSSSSSSSSSSYYSHNTFEPMYPVQSRRTPPPSSQTAFSKPPPLLTRSVDSMW